MNFNREGCSFNQRNSSLYDLTRMQPQPYWPVNHLLMRIKYDTKQQDITFKRGDTRIEDWEILKGAGEYKKESIILTSLPEKEGLMRLKNHYSYGDVDIKVRLEGNSFGGQKVLFRGNKDFTSCLSAGIEQGKLVIAVREGAGEKKLFEEKLSVLDGETPISIEEDKNACVWASLPHSPAMQIRPTRRSSMPPAWKRRGIGRPCPSKTERRNMKHRRVSMPVLTASWRSA